MAMTLKWNELLLTPFDFAIEACINGAAFGVKTSCEVCSGYFNKCLKDALAKTLFEYQHTAERELGFGLTTQYHSEEVIWNGKKTKVQLQHRNVVALNVQETATAIEDYGPWEISPFLVTAELIDSGESYCLVRVPVEYVDDPDKLAFWNNNRKIETQSITG
jgi:hypothetical protein